MRDNPVSNKIYSFGRIAIVLVSILAYLPALRATFVWDDWVLTDGSAIGGGDSLLHCFTRPFLKNYYRPLVSASFFLENRLFHNTPLFYHQTNILLHALTAAVVVAVLKSAFRSRAVSLAGGLVFALHPAQVGAVAWIGGRTDSLCALFTALFCLYTVRAAQSTGRIRKGNLAASGLFYFAALITKEQVFPAILLVPLAFRCFGEPDESSGRRAWLAAAPHAAGLIAFAALYKLSGPHPPEAMLETPIGIVTQALRTTTSYALLLFAPTPWSMNATSLGWLVRSGAWPILFGVGIAALGIAGYCRLLSRCPAATWFIAYVALTLAAVVNLWPVPSMLVTPYRACLPSLGSSALLGWAGVYVARTLRKRWAADQPRARRLWATVPGAAWCVTVVVWFGGLTCWGASTWRNEETIAGTMVRCDPDSLWARLNLVTSYLQTKRPARAKSELETALSRLLGPRSWRTGGEALAAVQTNQSILRTVREVQGTRFGATRWLSSLYSTLGYARFDCGGERDAVEAFQTAIQLDGRNSKARLGMATVLMEQGDSRGALPLLESAVGLDPDDFGARAKLGKVYSQLNRWPDARRQYEICVRQQPWVTEAWVELAGAAQRLGDPDGAARSLREALRRSPHREDIRDRLARLQPAAG